MEKNKGITLIALVITIIVLLILAGVTIATLTSDNGLLQKATNAKEKSLDAEIEEEIRLAWNKVYADSYLNNTIDKTKLLANELGIEEESVSQSSDEKKIKIKNYKGKNKIIDIGAGIISNQMTIVDAKKIEKFDDNTSITDSNGNEFIVPKGFKIASDSADIVTKGIVIEDAMYIDTLGSQFVWVPLEIPWKSDSSKKIELARYTFKTSGEDKGTLDTKITDGSTISIIMPWGENIIYTFTEYPKNSTGTGPNGHIIAKDIEDFKIKTNKFGGFWIGRYEARKNADNKLTENAIDTVWNNITQRSAASLSRNMYDTNDFFESDLINSYAWDTTTLFLQEYDDRQGENLKLYSIQNSLNTSPLSTGTIEDKICNIYDMSSNYWEFTTEGCSGQGNNCAVRGGRYNGMYTSFRGGRIHTVNEGTETFRPILYIKQVN